MTPPNHHNPHRKSINSISHFYNPIKPNKLFFLLISMATSIFLLYSLLLSSVSSSASSSVSHRKGFTKTPPFTVVGAVEIQMACKATRYPDPCQSMLTQSNRVPQEPSPVDIIESAIWVSAQNLKTVQSMVQEILDSSDRDPTRSKAASTCLEVLGNSEFRSSAAAEAVSRDSLKDARAWASAALYFQYDCWSGLKYVNDTSGVNQTMSFLDTTLIVSTSNALSMMRALDVYGADLSSWAPPKTERDGFWEPVEPGQGPSGSGPLSGLTADVTVCKGGDNGCYETVQEAVNAAPENLDGGKKFVIKIEEGVYEEIVRVPLMKRNVVFLGDGMGKTVITGSLSTGIQGITTYNTATVGVLGDGFMASGLTFENTAGPEAHQAVAFRSNSDFSYIENCEFLGNQDTLYVHSLRQLYKSCHIEGNVDFIFGNAAAIFQDCTILVRPRQMNPEKGEKNSLTAQGRTDPAQTTGLVFLSCLINGTDEYMKLYYSKPTKHRNYLGRPWKLFSRVVYINCTIEALISSDGWLPWNGDFALSTLYYGEVGNSGPGADLSNRVPWSSQIPSEYVSTYYVQNFLQGNEWMITAS